MTRRWPVPLAAICAWLDVTGSPAVAQVVDNLGFRALPRPIRYETALNPPGGGRAVIVYGREAPWTRTAAEAVQRAVEAWCGLRLDLADDQTVTSPETWLLRDPYRATPLILLGNARDNRAMHALGVRYLLNSNRTWPGGDRYLIRSLFEPFAANMNQIALEASTPAGLDGAVAAFAALLAALPPEATASATLPPRIRVVAGGKDTWEKQPLRYKLPPEWAGQLDRSVSDLAGLYAGEPVTAGWEAVRGPRAGFAWELWTYMVGGSAQQPDRRVTSLLDPGQQRALGALLLLGCRAVGGRTHTPMDHYGAPQYICALRALLQTALLTPEEVNEVESCFVLSGAYPNMYFYDHIGNGDGIVGGPWGERHSMACLLSTEMTLEYAAHHARLDAAADREIARRYAGTRRTIQSLVRSFRNNEESSCLGEDTVLMLYPLLYEGAMEHVRSGMLRRSADLFILTSDNLPGWSGMGCYAGLAGFSSSLGGMTSGWHGGSLVAAAAFYYGDLQYRWFLQKHPIHTGSEATRALDIHLDTAGAVAPPDRYLGVHALPFDERLYNVLEHPMTNNRSVSPLRRPPESFAAAVDRVAFRDAFDPQAAYLFLATSQELDRQKTAQNNSIARYTDLGQIWLYANTMKNTAWARSVVSISNGRASVPRAGCTLAALANLGAFSAVASREQGANGAAWTRTLVHWRGHYFVALDRLVAEQDDDFAFVCRWRSPQAAALEQGVWTATAPDGSVLRIQSAAPVFQTAEYWPCDGSERPSVLQQYRQAFLKKGEAAVYQNLLYVSGATRPDRFEARRVGASAVLVRGETAEGPHLALIGVNGALPIKGFATDAAIAIAEGNRLHLAEATFLRVEAGGVPRNVIEKRPPVNVLLDCATGQAEIDASGTDPAATRAASEQPVEQITGQRVVAAAAPGALPAPAALLEALWARTPPAAAAPAHDIAAEPSPFVTRSAGPGLQPPLRRVRTVQVSATPPPGAAAGHRRQWASTDRLQIVLAFPEPTAVACLRVVGAGNEGRGYYERGYGAATGAADDLAFTLALSDDGFRQDVRRLDAPAVTFEETASIGVGHFAMKRLPTWRVAVNAKAREIRLMPRATNPARPGLQTAEIEVYGPERTDELEARALAADLDGDGSNELVVGTSERELAAYGADGRRLWSRLCPGDILRLGAADLNADGRAETLAYLTAEELWRLGGDGTALPRADLRQAQFDLMGRAGVGAMVAMAAWGPDGADRQEVLLWAEACFRVLPDGTTRPFKMPAPQGAAALTNWYPNEPLVLAAVSRYGLSLWSARRDAGGDYLRLGTKPVTGTDAGEAGGFSWVCPVDLPAGKGVLAAIETGLQFYPAAAFLPGRDEKGWGFDTAGVPLAAALLADANGDGQSEVLLGRVDGFVNVLRAADGAAVGLLNARGPILGMAMLDAGPGGRPCLAVGTRFGVRLFGRDLKPAGSHAIQAAAFAGPGGPARDRVYVVSRDGGVTVLAVETGGR